MEIWRAEEASKALVKGVVTQVAWNVPPELPNGFYPNIQLPSEDAASEGDGTGLVVALLVDRTPENAEERTSLNAEPYAAWVTSGGKEYSQGASYSKVFTIGGEEVIVGFQVQELHTPQQVACCGECNCHGDCIGKIGKDGTVFNACGADLKCYRYVDSETGDPPCTSTTHCFPYAVNFTGSCPAGTSETGRIELGGEICLTCEDCSESEDPLAR